MKTHFRVLFWALLLPLLGGASDVKACAAALRKIEEAASKAQYQFGTTATINRVPQLHGSPLHLTDYPYLDRIWVTNPASGNDYASIQKGDSGFFFGRATANHFVLVQDPSTTLRSLDFSASDQAYALATFVIRMPKASSLVFKLARIKDSSTGELELISEVKGFSLDGILDGIKDAEENFVVSPRPGSHEFWIADSSSSVRVIGLSGDGTAEIKLLRELRFPKSVKIGDRREIIKGVSKIHFITSGKMGFAKVLLSRNRKALIPFAVVAEKIEPSSEAVEVVEPSEADGSSQSVEQEAIVEHVLFFPKLMNQLSEGSIRTSVDPNAEHLFVSYPDRVELWRWNDEAQRIEHLRSFDMDVDLAHYEIGGLEFYQESDVHQVKNEKGEPSYEHSEPQSRAVLLLIDKVDRSTRTLWLEMSSSTNSGSLLGK
ncbi:MAG: hypothetical protein COV44_09735 [Deltaproteobacteria bacterium CG11_big_fil_rev_8_21_14_0_20_45_16]|nr:MAG: hypothetical protein COV44_09735 [Deltaproteobacteria bacterium CG11_big_fil_rev_8_21_14_0_20_45_16]